MTRRLSLMLAWVGLIGAVAGSSINVLLLVLSPYGWSDWVIVVCTAINLYYIKQLIEAIAMMRKTK